MLEGKYLVVFVLNPEAKSIVPTMKTVCKGGRKYLNVKRYHFEKAQFFQKNPEHATAIRNNALFHEANEMCRDIYVKYGLLDPNENFEENPDMYCVVLYSGEVVGTMGYIYESELPIRKTYKNLKICNNAQELVRMAILPNIGKRVEPLRVNFAKRQHINNLYKADKGVCRIGEHYCRTVRIADEVGYLLFRNMLWYYTSRMCHTKDTPEIWISTHRVIKRFYDKILSNDLGESIFEVKEGVEINWNGIPKKSWRAYERLVFQPMRIKIEKLLPQFFPVTPKIKTKHWKNMRILFQPQIVPSKHSYATA